jgi:hypothetical protein
MKTYCKIVLIMIIALTCACSPSHRLAKLIENHPELTTIDTLLLKDTIAVPLAEADTCLDIRSAAEPVFITQGRLEMEIKVKHDTIHLKGKCKADTIYRIRSVPFERIKLVKPDRTDAIIAHIPWLVAGMIAIMVSGGFALHKLNIC